MDIPIYFEGKLVSLNKYRNNHWSKQNKEKKYFHSIIKQKLNTNIRLKKFRLEFTLYPKNLGCDGGNIISLIEKYFLDALKESEVITDDNLNFHIGSSWKFEKIDKDNPKVEVRIFEVL